MCHPGQEAQWPEVPQRVVLADLVLAVSLGFSLLSLHIAEFVACHHLGGLHLQECPLHPEEEVSPEECGCRG